MVTRRPRYDLLIAGGRLVDPRAGRDGRFDLALAGGRVAAVAPRIDPAEAARVHDAEGLMVVPGLIDLHTHVYHSATALGVAPDPLAARSGVTTLVDAGSAGAGTYAGLRDFVIRPAATRVLAYLNISYPGIFAFDRGMMVGEAADRALLSVAHCVAVAEANRDTIVGIKVRMGAGTSGELGLAALDCALDAAERAGLPLMSHIGRPPPSYAAVVDRLRPGDVLTHCFRPAPNAPVDEAGRVLPALRRARERGVLFDIGHGMGAFGFDSAEQAVAEGFAPDIVSSDVHSLCVDGPAYDLAHTMSKLVACGVPIADVLAMATDAPARALRRPDLGHLGEGAVADVTLIAPVPADFPFRDVTGGERRGRWLLRPAGLYRAGTFVAPAARPFEAGHDRPAGGRSDRDNAMEAP